MTDEQRKKIVRRLRKRAEDQDQRAERAAERAKRATPGSELATAVSITQREAFAVAWAYRDAACMVEDAEC